MQITIKLFNINYLRMKNKKKKNAFLSFQIGNETFAVSVGKALEVLEKQHVTQIPNVPQYVKGVINFRGNIIPVIDTRLKFNLIDLDSANKYVIIVLDLTIENRKMLIGAMADSVQDVIAIDDSSIMEVPEIGFNYNTEYLLGMIKTDLGFTMILDIDRVFSSDEIGIIKVDKPSEDQNTYKQ